MIDNSKIKALISLVDDSDESIYFQVRDEILMIGLEAVPHLEEAWEKNVLDPLFQDRLEYLIHEIQFSNVSESLLDWAKTGGKQLLTGVLLINKYHYPDLNTSEVKSTIQKLGNRLNSIINPDDNLPLKISKLNQVLYSEFQFQGDHEDYYSPKNSFISKVLERRKGNPLLLSVLYIEVARIAAIEVMGINLPRHFVVGIKNNYSNIIEFYVSPYNRGSILSQDDLEIYLKKINLPVEPKYYEECSNIAIILRILLNLINSYTKSKETKKLDEISLLYNSLIKIIK